jgi:urea transporter
LAVPAFIDLPLPWELLSGSINSLGEIFLQDSPLFALIVLIAITALRWQKGVLALFGVIVCILFMPALDEVDRFYSGLLGYNIVLTALALDELIELDLFSIRQLLIIFLYLTLSLLLSKIGFIIADIGIIPALTAPFVIATWLILAYEKRKNKATA